MCPGAERVWGRGGEKGEAEEAETEQRRRRRSLRSAAWAADNVLWGGNWNLDRLQASGPEPCPGFDDKPHNSLL